MSRLLSNPAKPLPCGHSKALERFVSYYLGCDRKTKHTKYVCEKCWKEPGNVVGLTSHRSDDAVRERNRLNREVHRAKAKRAGSGEGTSPFVQPDSRSV